MRAWRAWRLPGRWPDGSRNSTVARWTRRGAAPAYASIPDLNPGSWIPRIRTTSVRLEKKRALCTRDQSSEGFTHRNRVNSVGSSTPHVPFFYDASEGCFNRPSITLIEGLFITNSYIYLPQLWGAVRNDGKLCQGEGRVQSRRGEARLYCCKHPHL